MDTPIYGFAVEPGLHLLRIITAGLFDRFPRLRLVVGHLREALPVDAAAKKAFFQNIAEQVFAL